MLRTASVFVALGLLLGFAGCGGADDQDEGGSVGTGGRSAVGEFEFPDAPQAPGGELEPGAAEAAADLSGSLASGGLDGEALGRLAESGDARLAWLLSDGLRFAQTGGEQDALVAAFEQLTGADPSADPTFARSPWLSVSNHLIAWDLPAPSGYTELKGELFTALEPGWEPFFADQQAEIDWRLVSWGGVLIDDRPAGATEPCPDGCIPALDDPPLTGAEGGDWYPDDRIVFGVEIDGEAVAFPKNIMEVHEMVNITIGDRRLGIPYCTLCGSAQAYFTDRDQVRGEDLVLRTSGLLSRSNKVMYELGSASVFDTFTGEALSGPLRERGVQLEQASLVTTSWGEWKREYPDTRIVARDAGLGQSYPLDPLGGRDDNGPIFPVGPVDPRLEVQAPVLGVLTEDGEAIAFPARAARETLENGGEVSLDGVSVRDQGGGLRAQQADGTELPVHEAFWFAWSQFYPETALWES